MTQSSDPHKALRVEIEIANTVAAHAALVREDLRWTVAPGDSDREAAIGAQLYEIDQAMRPIRSAIGGLAWRPLPSSVEASLREVSASLQYQRKQLKKMQRPPSR